MPPPLMLASVSPYRAAQLRRLGLEFAVAAPGVDEDVWKSRGLPPHDLASALALAKAQAVAARHPDALVIGGDQLVALGDRVFGKPGSAEAAVAQLLALAGQTHELVTAVALVAGSRERVAVEIARLAMRPLSPAEAERYVAADRPFDCAGAYKWECRGPALFQSVRARDPSAIEGLPLIALCDLLRAFGYPLP